MVNKKNGGLGRGLEALIPKDFDSSLLLESDERVQKLLIIDLQPNPDQPRTHFDESTLNELATSIKRYGILQPLVVTPANDQTYYIIAGERRWRAASLAGLKSVPAIVRSNQKLERLEIALVENVQRVDLSPLEQAISIHRLNEQFNLSYEDMSQRLGKAVTTLKNIVRLLQLPKNAQHALENEKITEGHGRSILALKGSPEKQEELLQLIQKHHWSVRKAEQYVTAFKSGATSKTATNRSLRATTKETRTLSKLITAPVSIRRTAKGGKLEIDFKTDEELTAILKNLTNRK